MLDYGLSAFKWQLNWRWTFLPLYALLSSTYRPRRKDISLLTSTANPNILWLDPWTLERVGWNCQGFWIESAMSFKGLLCPTAWRFISGQAQRLRSIQANRLNASRVCLALWQKTNQKQGSLFLQHRGDLSLIELFLVASILGDRWGKTGV